MRGQQIKVMVSLYLSLEIGESVPFQMLVASRTLVIPYLNAEKKLKRFLNNEKVTRSFRIYAQTHRHAGTASTRNHTRARTRDYTTNQSRKSVFFRIKTTYWKRA